MNVHRTATLTAALLLAATAAAADRYPIHEKIVQVPDRAVEVEIWTDRGEGARYSVGEPIEIYFRTNVDAWVAIYDIDTRGRILRLFPSPHHPDNFVYGGEVYRLPSRYGHHFEVEGPPGWETLRAVASTDRLALQAYGDGEAKGARYRPGLPPAYSPRITSVPNKIREVPDGPPHRARIAVAEARHYVRDGYRWRLPRPWWRR